MTGKEKGILAVTVSAHAIIHMCELTFPATALAVTADLLDAPGAYVEIGFASFLFGFLFGAAAVPAGRLVDRLGPRAVLAALLFASGGALLLLALSPNFIFFTVVLALLGLVSGFYHPAGTTLISLGVTQSGRGMGIHGVGGNIGLAITPFLAAALGRALGWRGAYAAIGALPIILGIVLLATRAGHEQPAPSENKPAADPGGRGYRLLPLTLIFMMAVFNGMTYRGLMTFLPAYFTEKVHLPWLHLDPGVVGGTMTTAILLLGVVGQYIGGNLADRIRMEKLYTVIFLAAAPVLATLGFLQDLPLVAVTALFAFLYFMNQPVGNSLIPRHAEPGIRGSIFGLFFFMSFGAGSIMGPIAGAVGERFELQSIFAILAGSILLSGLLGLVLIWKTRRLS